jgi:hypothetical protein
LLNRSSGDNERGPARRESMWPVAYLMSIDVGVVVRPWNLQLIEEAWRGL